MNKPKLIFFNKAAILIVVVALFLFNSVLALPQYNTEDLQTACKYCCVNNTYITTGGSMDYTNIAMTNKSNVFTEVQTFSLVKTNEISYNLPVPIVISSEEMAGVLFDGGLVRFSDDTEFSGTNNYFMYANIEQLSGIYAHYSNLCYSNGSNCASGGNSSFNQTLTDNLYATKYGGSPDFINVTTSYIQNNNNVTLNDTLTVPLLANSSYLIDCELYGGTSTTNVPLVFNTTITNFLTGSNNVETYTSATAQSIYSSDGCCQLIRPLGGSGTSRSPHRLKAYVNTNITDGLYNIKFGVRLTGGNNVTGIYQGSYCKRITLS